MATFNLTDSSDTQEGTESADIIRGFEGNDDLFGLGGNDKLYGGPGLDELYGGNGDDYIEANESVMGSGSRDELYGEAGNDTLRPGGGSYADMHGGEGNDDIVGATFGYVEGGPGADKLVGTGGFIGTDLSYRSSDAAVSVHLGKNNASGGHASGDTIRKFANVVGSQFDDILKGSGKENGLSGGDGDDRLFGFGGDDGLTGGNGTDELHGMGGDDTLRGGDAADVLDGAKGEDTASYSEARSAVVASLENQGRNAGEAAGDVYKSIEHLEGSSYDDKLFGDNGDNEIRDFGGADVVRGGRGDDIISNYDSTNAPARDRLFGEGGADLIFLGAGGDIINGGKGKDTLSFSFGAEPIEKLFLDGRPSKGGNAEGAQITNMEIINAPLSSDMDIIGAGKAEEITGGSGDNTIVGQGGNDVLDGRAGDDVLKGGGGRDLLIGDAGADKLVGNKGRDTVDYISTFDDIVVNLAKGTGRGDDAEGDTLFGIEDVLSGFGDDVIVGDSANNMLDGYFGDDVLKGGVGKDKLVGGSGNDVIRGGGGKDTLLGGSGVDKLAGGGGSDRFVFQSTSEAGSVDSPDVIVDFNRKQNDQIVLKAIDARDNKKDKNDAFSFIGKAAFSGSKGELRVDKGGSKTFVYGDTDGDKVADFAIKLDGGINLKQGDFVL